MSTFSLNQYPVYYCQHYASVTCLVPAADGVDRYSWTNWQTTKFQELIKSEEDRGRWSDRNMILKVSPTKVKTGHIPQPATTWLLTDLFSLPSSVKKKNPNCIKGLKTRQGAVGLVQSDTFHFFQPQLAGLDHHRDENYCPAPPACLGQRIIRPMAENKNYISWVIILQPWYFLYCF